ncbi:MULTISPECIES: methyltransferase domain-containing protein [Prochlorococcus]|uniref:SAM-dependent methyltransferase n=1 Tax=Prochlorococcus marinus (strain SARG / CCMP1375 / SS120) TaxID=167539 RepID=Q7VAX9_PROMA|nr:MULTISPECIES: methyltransferase domain-containing protein [Prochlorococcus]AAQ00368.1 SAM-dependent methyltransferase [Prochlorococcus marinus subsp. marinus str. CCMP1375]KGG14248.1 hypothetical protein EV04_0100 [Prochlorococcus marinus str. LG]KGG22179.1 hypothetical protein EV08_0354 [Prochlorococcus marinus str. SS2]KGG24503.1 hypothetical protein EV09_0134 [Prochlorococcus marinus str. SS35]KGG33398.1 hypothetical protein EV10_0606 [Prochlorococcus marinus str. SS51]
MTLFLNNKKDYKKFSKSEIDIFNYSSFVRTIKDVYTISIQRSLMNQLLEGIEFKGNILDIGGGNRASYKKTLGNEEYTSVNIDTEIEPDIKINVGEKIPIKDKLFAHCLMFNLLEHVYNWDDLFIDAHRLLIKGGKLHIIMPFMYPIHGAPQDFKRVTETYFEEYLKKMNFENIKIYPLSYGPFTNSQLVGLTHRYFNGPHAQLCVILDRILQLYSKRIYYKYNRRCPLFYYVESSKK